MIRQMISDVQIFLATRQIDKTVSNEIQSIKELIRSKCFEIKIEVDSTVSSLLNSVDQLGIILVDERTHELEFKDAKLDQAQHQVLVPIVSSSRVIDLQLKESFDFSVGYIQKVTACSILPNNHLIIIATCCRKECIKEYEERGQYVQDISCSNKPIYLTLIDSDRIAVTYLDKGYIDIINLNNKHVQKIISLKKSRGIAYHYGKLYVVKIRTGIFVLDLSGEILHTIGIRTTNVYGIATAKERIYYTNTRTKFVYCLKMLGKNIWVYKHGSVIRPAGIAVTSDKDVFVACHSCNMLCILKQNGTENKILLSKANGLIEPKLLNYNKDRNELLVFNEMNGKAAVYKVIVG